MAEVKKEQTKPAPAVTKAPAKDAKKKGGKAEEGAAE